MPINARATHSFRIVQVNGREAVATNNSIEFTKCFLRPHLRTELITSGKEVSSIDANAEPFGLAHIANDVRNLFEAMTETRALASRSFERDLRFHPWDYTPHRIDRCGDFLQPGFFAGAEVCAGMHNKKWQLEVIGPNQLLC